MMYHRALPALLLVAVACMDANGPTVCTQSAALACVTIQDFTFSPASMTIKAGTTVEWVNNGPSAHTTTSDSAGVWNSGTLNGPTGSGPYGGGSAGGSFRYTFATPGTYGYHCSIHPPSAYPGFTGTITVTP